MEACRRATDVQVEIIVEENLQQNGKDVEGMRGAHPSNVSFVNSIECRIFYEDIRKMPWTDEVTSGEYWSMTESRPCAVFRE